MITVASILISIVLVTIITKSCSTSSLSRARSLETPQVTAIEGGETEHLDFWQTHEDLLQQAWKEWGKEQQENLPGLDDDTIVMDPNIVRRTHQLRDNPSVPLESAFQRDFWSNEQIPNVYTCRSFLSPRGIHRLRQHLTASSQAKIPTRRPNGMNRCGLVLDDETQGGVSYPEMDSFRHWLVTDYVRPMARMLFPEWIGSYDDDENHYAFTIHYKKGKEQSNENNATKTDVQLKEHTDASVVTINININLPQEDADEEDYYEGSDLLFFNEDSGERHSIKFEPGMAVIHRGLHRHQALPIQKGERHQLIIWLFGRDGYVRILPYDKEEQLTVTERWSKDERERSHVHVTTSLFEL